MPKQPALPTTVRPLYEIAREIASDPNLKGNSRIFASPYLRAMGTISTITDRYLYEDGETQVLYALSNLSHYRGETAKRVKAELKAHLAGVRPA